MSKKKKKQEKSPDLNVLFVQVEQFSDQYRFHLSQLAEDSWQALFERMDTVAFLGDVSAKAETPAKAVELALVLVKSQTELENKDI